MKIPVVFTVDNKWALPTYIAVHSLFESARLKTEYICIIISEDLDQKNKEEIEKLQKGTRHSIQFLNLNKLPIEDIKVTNYWTKEVYFRLFLCDILQEYDKVIFSDVDVLFINDLSNAYKVDLSNSEIAAVAAEKNSSKAKMHTYYSENNHSYIYWDGFMVMNLQLMREREWSKRCIEFYRKYADTLNMVDLEIINLAALNPVRLPIRYVYLQSLWSENNIKKSTDYIFLKDIYTIEELENEKKHVVIIHYAGEMGKPWLRLCMPKEYKNYYVKAPEVLIRENRRYRIKQIIHVVARSIYRHTIKRIIQFVESI